jgi:ribose transport system ATP-binding protein
MNPMASETAAIVVDMRNIVKSYPGVLALNDVSFDVRAGEVHALAGKNGAGKSTLMQVLNGLCLPDSGTIRIRETEFSGLTAARAKREGIALVAQHAKFVPGLSIAENLCLGAVPTKRGFVDWSTLYSVAQEKLGRFGLEIDVSQRMEMTSVAERQMIEIARALFADASVIILDEPTAPLPKREVERLFGFVRKQKEQGASFIYISHYLDEIFEIADRATVLRNGKVTGAAAVADLTQQDLVHMISGTSVKRFTRKSEAVGKEVLGIKSLTRDRAYYDVNLWVRAGEVVGLTGLEGSGPGALARGLFGLEEMGAGYVTIDGKAFKGGSPSQALDQGLAYLPRDRHGLGIVSMLSVRENMSLSVLERLKSGLGLVDHKKERALVNEYMASLSIKTPTMETPISSLSGGNQQKCVVAKFAATEPRVLILDEPTQGVDVEAKVEILRIVDDLSNRGVAICVVSDELNELIDICDRIIVFKRGRISREYVKGQEEITPKGLIAAIEGVSMEEEHEHI